MGAVFSDEEYRHYIKGCTFKKIVIYGAGKYGRLLLGWCKENDITVDCFCVTSMDNNAEFVQNVDVKTIDIILETKESTLFLIGVEDDDEIKNSLIEKGAEYLPFPAWLKEKDDWNKTRYETPRVELTPLIGCNENCKYCPQSLLLSEYFKNDKNRASKMSFDDYKYFLNRLPGNIIVDFSGFVEPFLNGEAIDMMEYTYHKGIEMTLFSTLKNVDVNTAKRIIHIPFKTVIIHLPDEEVNSNIPINETYKKVLEIIVNAKHANGDCFVTSGSCHGTLHHEIAPIIKGKVRLTGKMMDRAGNLDNTNGELKCKSVLGKIRCTRSMKLNHNVLLPDGTLVFCCNDYGMRHVLGNIRESTYEDIMNGSVLVDIYHGLDDDKNSVLCRKCIYAEEDEI